jgi:uncharacterized protein YcfJ
MISRMRWAVLAAALTGLAACARYHEYQPKVDMTGHTQAQYDYDLLLCRENARELDVLKGAPIGVIAGTALGAGAGALAGDAGMGAATGAPAGAIAGAAAGSLYGQVETVRTGVDPHAVEIRQCLEQRGYKILDPAPTPAAAPPAPAAQP